MHKIINISIDILMLLIFIIKIIFCYIIIRLFESLQLQPGLTWLLSPFK